MIMNRPELRVIDGEDSADKRIMGFVKEHTRPEIADYPGEHIYSIRLLLGLDGSIVFEIQYDDNPEIGFRDIYTEPLSDDVVDSLIGKLSLAEANGKLIEI